MRGGVRVRAHNVRRNAFVSVEDCVGRRRKGLAGFGKRRRALIYELLARVRDEYSRGLRGLPRPTLLWRKTREP